MKVRNKIITLLLICIFVLSLFSVTASAAAEGGNGLYNIDASKAGDYVFLLKNPQKLSDGKSVDISVNLPQGIYEPILLYSAADQSAQEVEYSLKLDGAYPFEEASMLTAPVYYQDDGDFITLLSGDQTASTQKQLDGLMSSAAYDIEGVRLTPYTVDISEGVHTVTVTSIGNDFNICGIAFNIPEDLKSYKEVQAGYNSVAEYNGRQITIEAEKPLYRNDFSLTAKSDTGSGDITPRSATKSLINYIGGSTWSRPAQELTWEFEVPEDGLYSIGFSFKQNTIINGNSYRWLKIDGKTPFEEAATIAFPYKSAWQYKNFSDENGEDYLFHLTKGKHTVSLAVTLVGVSEVYDILNEICANIGDTYLDIVMITGETPDANRDYELYKQIPDFQEKLLGYYNELTVLSDSLNSNKDINGELDGAVKNMARVSKQMYDEKYASHLYLDTFYSYYQTLSSWLYEIKNMGLSLDKIIISAPGSEVNTERMNIFQKFGFSFTRFIKSFAGDYSNMSLADTDVPTIKLWVNWGRDQVKVLNTLVQESFSSKENINVKIEQVNASIIQGVISNNSPDLYLHLARTEPVNLAMRGVLRDLSSYPDFEEVLGNFQEGAELPYMYKDKCYALPDTQSFNVMFVRDDIFNELGLSVPETWDEYLSAIAVIQRRNMNAYLPYVRINAATTVNTGAGGLTIYPTMLMQAGGNLYNDELNSTNLGSPISVEIFKMWTDFYTKYKLNPDVNFYQRFRVGTIPIGIASYSNYLTFAVAAPEIEGKWSVHPIPGFRNADGSINRVSSGSGTGCSIMKSTKEPEAAWKFLKWWVSADTQYSYSANVEAILGPSGRVATANVEALSRLAWDENDLAVILKQWKEVKELPEVPGSYYVSRSIDQAFWAVYNGTKREKAAITEWGKVSNNEIARKIAEYSNKIDQ